MYLVSVPMVVGKQLSDHDRCRSVVPVREVAFTDRLPGAVANAPLPRPGPSGFRIAEQSSSLCADAAAHIISQPTHMVRLVPRTIRVEDRPVFSMRYLVGTGVPIEITRSDVRTRS